jgi:hypothetical protein
MQVKRSTLSKVGCLSLNLYLPENCNAGEEGHPIQSSMIPPSESIYLITAMQVKRATLSNVGCLSLNPYLLYLTTAMQVKRATLSNPAALPACRMAHSALCWLEHCLAKLYPMILSW